MTNPPLLRGPTASAGRPRSAAAQLMPDQGAPPSAIQPGAGRDKR